MTPELRVCGECGNPLVAKRQDARFCSRKCKERAGYKRRNSTKVLRSWQKRASSPALSWRHNTGDYTALIEELLEVQGGKCYLCEDKLNPQDAVIDHDHSCCPRKRSCAKCRRGIAHSVCNSIIGYARDDPDFLYRIAGNLEKSRSTL